MAKSMKGDVVVVPFPFSDLTQTRRRPAFVIASLEGDDVIFCQITSQTIRDQYAISINDDDFETGSLKQPRSIRPNRVIYDPPSEGRKLTRSFQKWFKLLVNDAPILLIPN